MTYHLTTLTKSDIKDYPKAIQKELKSVQKKELPFTPWRWTWQRIEAGGIRLKEGFTPVPDGKYTLDFGDTFRGVSPKVAWEKQAPGFSFVCLLQYLRLVQEHPELLKEELYLDFAVDEVRFSDDWPFSPFVRQRDSQAYLDYFDAVDAYGDFGSFGCARSTGTLNVETLDSVEPLKFDQITELEQIRKELMGLANKVGGIIRKEREV